MEGERKYLPESPKAFRSLSTPHSGHLPIFRFGSFGLRIQGELLCAWMKNWPRDQQNDAAKWLVFCKSALAAREMRLEKEPFAG
jgi:hypothetical protein